MYYTNHFSALLSPVNSTAPIQSKVQQLLCQTPRNTSGASQKLREAVFNGNCFQATFLSPEITRRFLNHMFVIIFPHKCLKIFHVMPSQKIHHQLKKPTTITVIHFNITSGQSPHVDMTLPSLVTSTKTQRRSASLKPASRVPRFSSPTVGPPTGNSTPGHLATGGR